MRKAKQIYQAIISGLTVIIFILAIYIIVGTIVANKKGTMLSVFGFTYSVVPTESMLPTIKVGDAVIGKKVKYDTLEVGDIIIYRNDKEGIFVVHRIVQQDEYGFRTKGDNNSSIDDIVVTKDNYIAKYVWNGSLANIGTFVIGHKNYFFLALVAILSIISINGIFDIIKITEEKKKQENEEVVEETEEEKIERLKKEIYAELENKDAHDEEENL